MDTNPSSFYARHSHQIKFLYRDPYVTFDAGNEIFPAEYLSARTFAPTMEFLVLGLFVVISFSFWLWNTYNKMKRDLKSCDPLPPGSFGIPIFGETFSFLMQVDKLF